MSPDPASLIVNPLGKDATPLLMSTRAKLTTLGDTESNAFGEISLPIKLMGKDEAYPESALVV
jgi:hypothetical protein